MELLITEKHWNLITKVIQEADKEFGECSWLGVGTRQGSNAVIDRIVFPDQENSSTASDMDELSINEVTMSLKPGETVLWWGHSHAKMSTFFSGTDWETWDNWIGPDKDLDFFFASVHNAKGDDPFELVHWHGETFEKSGILTIEEIIDEELEEAVEEAMLGMSKPVFKSIAPYSYGSKANSASVLWSHTSQYYDDDDFESGSITSATGVTTLNPHTKEWVRTPYKDASKHKK